MNGVLNVATDVAFSEPILPQPDRFVLTSSYFTVLELLCDELREVLRKEGSMNITQYRILLKVYETAGERNRISDLATVLRLQANVVTQATNTLEEQGLVRRLAEPGDARARSVSITGAGIVRIVHVDTALQDHLYSVWDPVSEEMFRTVQEAIIAVGAGFEGVEQSTVHRTSVVSVYLSALVAVEESTIDALRSATGASFSECRILQRLAEVGEPIRAMDLASGLLMQANTVTRAANRLENRGWVRRLSDPNNLQAVFLDVTEQGVEAQRSILDTIDTVAQERIWSKLDPMHQDVVYRIAGVVLNGMRTGQFARGRHVVQSPASR